MGKHNIPKIKTSKDEDDEYDSQIDELYRPFLIHSTTYLLLTEQILSLMPSERNVLLTMNEYDLSEINPMHPDTAGSPTHVIIFCIRFVAGDTFQPIGGLLTYKYKDQSIILAECLKAYINDLWKLGLYVVGTVSPPFECFKGMLSHLVDVGDVNTFSGCLVYSVTPIKEIVHIYDIQFLLIKLQNLFKEGDIKFVELSKEHRASWNDISLVLNLSKEFKILSNYLLDNKDVSRRVHIFTQQIFEQLLEMEAQGFLSNCAGGSAVLLNCMRSFLQFTELDFVDLYQMCQVQGWDNLTNILSTMTFQKSKKRTCTKEKPTAIHVVSNPSVRRKIDFYLEENSKAIENVTQNMSEMAVTDTPDERFHKDSCENFENYNNDDNSSNTVTLTEYCKKSEIKSCKQRKNKMKDYKDNLNRTKMAAVDQTTSVALGSVTKTKLHLKKPYDKQTTGHIAKNTNTSEENEKTDIKNNTNYIIKKDNDIKTNFVNDKLSGKTEHLLKNKNKKSNHKEHVKKKFNCDRDKNNNSEGNLRSTRISKNEKTISEVKSDSNTKINNILREEDFDVINPEKFLESFIGYNIYADGFDLAGFQEIFSNNFQPVEENYSLKNGFVTTKKKTCDVVDNVPSNDANCNDFSSQTDEETENSVTKICDKIPTIVESLSHGDTVPSNDFEYNDVTFEMMCTVFGMKRLMQNLLKRRVRVAKPDAFVVEHIDFLVTVIKRDKNGLNPVYYYGHNYAFLNSELAFSTLQHNTGLFLVKT